MLLVPGNRLARIPTQVRGRQLVRMCLLQAILGMPPVRIRSLFCRPAGLQGKQWTGRLHRRAEANSLKRLVLSSVVVGAAARLGAWVERRPMELQQQLVQQLEATCQAILVVHPMWWQLMVLHRATPATPQAAAVAKVLVVLGLVRALLFELAHLPAKHPTLQVEVQRLQRQGLLRAKLATPLHLPRKWCGQLAGLRWGGRHVPGKRRIPLNWSAHWPNSRQG
mmetsp:Transcript_120444/g.384554  ORF Transcript_120444/g.384554 Transcript_120444/m.384554 type:complete len:223 (+) Transcript_120444:1296-1964(+)